MQVSLTERELEAIALSVAERVRPDIQIAMQEPVSEWLMPEECAKWLRISVKYLYQLRTSGALDPSCFGQLSDTTVRYHAPSIRRAYLRGDLPREIDLETHRRGIQ